MNAIMSKVVSIATQPPSETLDDLVHQLVNAKHAEEGAKKIRVGIEERILALVPTKEEGSSTTTLDNGFKLTCTGKLTYSCEDPRALAEACAGWPANMIPVKTEIKLDDSGCKWLRVNDPTAWATVARFVTVKPAKTAITVKA